MTKEIPPEVRAMNYEERVHWHRSRIERELPVYEFLESIQMDAEYEEVSYLLEKVRDKRKDLELQIKLLEYNRGEFTRINIEMSYHIAMLRTCMGRLRGHHLHCLLLWEERLICLCKELEVDPMRYIRSTEFRETTNGFSDHS